MIRWLVVLSMSNGYIKWLMTNTVAKLKWVNNDDSQQLIGSTGGQQSLALACGGLTDQPKRLACEHTGTEQAHEQYPEGDSSLLTMRTATGHLLASCNKDDIACK